ncbi:Xaa-Pro aminopeptidase [Anaeroplasma bactoclasticum]|uniref:Xaa-Pro aminopeptidase n=2 Tax=Anaeroplasma bactoclasticum TaxID=2088 RepID=A0A397RR65_9MOLU|nr:Xaa-Pro aminopeptidase [Anaeroplasma bactoclasticum]
MKMEQLELFQQQMKIYNIDAYIIPTGDFHNSEYVSDYFKGREWLSGFTGSAGTLLVTIDNAYLWTDGRYFIQAQEEIEGNGITLMKMGEDKTLEEFLIEFMKDKSTLAFDGRVLPASQVISLKEKLPNKSFVTDIDLVGNVWKERPKLPYSLIYKLDKLFTGTVYKEKLEMIREEMKEKGADYHILSSLEDQAWLYNLRANDVTHTPVFLAYTIISFEGVTLYVDPTKIDYSVDKYLNENDIHTKGYFDIYSTLKTLRGKKILMNLNKVNYQIYEQTYQLNEIINSEDPSSLLKAIKNPTEIENIKKAHIRDGVAMTKFMYYLKTGFQEGQEMSEISVSDYLEELRRADKGLVDLSFNTICGFKEHAAMMHYSATPESNYKIKGNGFLLVDSGGHYLEGTTDITRTFALGSISNEMKKHFTTVLKSNINLSMAVFLKGCTGVTLDVLARGPIWQLEMDYKCGTGHGVGYLLSVHEGPNSFRWKDVPGRAKSHEFIPGMVTTNEPGIYIKDKYGIRIENEMVCVEKSTNEYGTFLGFETITYCPIDLDAIQKNLLSQAEKDWLNDYHEMVFKKISPFLSKEEKEWLKDYTKKI